MPLIPHQAYVEDEDEEQTSEATDAGASHATRDDSDERIKASIRALEIENENEYASNDSSIKPNPVARSKPPYPANRDAYRFSRSFKPRPKSPPTTTSSCDSSSSSDSSTSNPYTNWHADTTSEFSWVRNKGSSSLGWDESAFKEVERDGLSVTIEVERSSDRYSSAQDFLPHFLDLGAENGVRKVSQGRSPFTTHEDSDTLAWSQSNTTLPGSGSFCETLAAHALERSLGRRGGTERITLVCPGGPRKSEDPSTIALRWLHVQRSSPSLKVLERLVSSCPYLTGDLAKVALMLLGEIESRFARRLGSNKYIEDGTALRYVGRYSGPPKRNEPRTTDPVMFLSCPQLMMKSGSREGAPTEDCQPRTLLQNFYGYAIEDGEKAQIVREMTDPKSNDTLHVGETWFFLIGSHLLISMSSMTAKEIRSDSVVVNIRSPSDGELLTVRLIDRGRQHNSVIDRNYTYADLLRHCVLIAKGRTRGILSYELREPERSVLTPERWVELVSSYTTSLFVFCLEYEDDSRYYYTTKSKPKGRRMLSYLAKEPRTLTIRPKRPSTTRHTALHGRDALPSRKPYYRSSSSRGKFVDLDSDPKEPDLDRAGNRRTRASSATRRYLHSSSSETSRDLKYSGERLVVDPIDKGAPSGEPLKPKKAQESTEQRPNVFQTGTIHAYFAPNEPTSPALEVSEVQEPDLEPINNTEGPMAPSAATFLQYEGTEEPLTDSSRIVVPTRSVKIARNEQSSQAKQIVEAASRTSSTSDTSSLPVSYWDRKRHYSINAASRRMRSRVLQDSQGAGTTDAMLGTVVNDRSLKPKRGESKAFRLDLELAEQAHETDDFEDFVGERGVTVSRTASGGSGRAADSVKSSDRPVPKDNSASFNVRGVGERGGRRGNKVGSRNNSRQPVKTTHKAKTATTTNMQPEGRPPPQAGDFTRNTSNSQAYGTSGIDGDATDNVNHGPSPWIAANSRDHNLLKATSIPFLAWRLHGQTEQMDTEGLEKTIMGILSSANYTIVEGQAGEIYSQSFKCTLQDLKQRHAFLSRQQDASHPSAEVRPHATTETEGQADGPDKEFGDTGHNSPGSRKGPDLSAETSMPYGAAEMIDLVRVSEQLLRAFVPGEGSALGHHCSMRFWGAVDAICRHVKWEGDRLGARKDQKYIISDFDASDLVKDEIHNPGGSSWAGCESCRSGTVYPSADVALDHLHTHNQCFMAQDQQACPEDPCYVWLQPAIKDDDMQDPMDVESILYLVAGFSRRLMFLTDQIIELHRLVANAGATPAGRGSPSRPPLATSLVDAFVEVLKFYILQPNALSFSRRDHSLIDPESGGPISLSWEADMAERDANQSFKDAQEFLKDAKKDIILMGGSNHYAESSGFQSVGAEFLVLSLIANVLNRKVMPPGLLSSTAATGHRKDHIEVYQHYFKRLRYQASRRPRKRLFLHMSALQEELAAVEKVFGTQGLFLYNYIRLLSPHALPITTETRVGLFEAEFAAGEKQARELSMRIKDIRDLSRQSQDLTQRVKQTIEIVEEDHGKAIRVFTIVTLFFLPLSFVASFMGMNTADIRDMERTQAIFWTTGMPFTALVVVAALVYGYYGEDLADWVAERIEARRARAGRRR